tara:strand:- start:509 stop:1465 length:957 start_codon:yes stop_codon:yes gene_type:complete
MSIHWYPGHMHKAQKEMQEVLPKIDLLIEVLDARIPYSSENPMIEALRGDKPCIKLLSKSDLADPAMTAQWQAHFESQKNVKTLAITTEQPSIAKQIPDLCRKLCPHVEGQHKTLQTMIVGIPNVGKSTLINTLAGKVIAKVGNEPAVTKSQQRINLGNGIMLCDTPGILWPKIENFHGSYRLAATGAIRDTAMEYEDVAFYLVDYLALAYPERLMARYQLKEMPPTEIERMEAIGIARACRARGGRVDLFKASEALLQDVRSGKLGRITFESPEMIAREEIAVDEKKAAKAAKEEARKKARVPQRQRDKQARDNKDH